MSDRIQIQFIRPCQAYRKGDIITMDRGPAKSLLLAGYAVEHRQEPQLLEVATVERRDVETADEPRRRKRR